MSASGNSVASFSGASSLEPSCSLGLTSPCAIRRFSCSRQPGGAGGGSCGAGSANLSSRGQLASMSDGGPTLCWNSS
eukprot:8096524-Alexandrium_andersonii.AAC.1